VAPPKEREAEEGWLRNRMKSLVKVAVVEVELKQRNETVVVAAVAVVELTQS